MVCSQMGLIDETLLKLNGKGSGGEKTNLSSTHVSLVVKPKLSQGVVSRKSLDQRHHALPSHIIRLYIQTSDGRVFPQHLSNGQGHGVVGSGVCEAEDSNVCVVPQGISKSNESFLRSKLEDLNIFQNTRKMTTLEVFETDKMMLLIGGQSFPLDI